MLEYISRDRFQSTLPVRGATNIMGDAALEAEREARNAKWEAERQQLERERAIREVEYHEARMKELEQK